MSIMKRIFALLGVTLGFVGLLLCLVVIIGTWWVKLPLTVAVLQVFPPIERAVGLVDDAVQQTSQLVTTTQARVVETADAREEKRGQIADAIGDDVVRVQGVVVAAESTVDTINQFVKAVDIETQTRGGERVVTAMVDKVTSQLDQVSASFDKAQGYAQALKEGRTDAASNLSTELDQIQTLIADVEANVDQGAAELADLKGTIPRWVNLGTLLVTLIFIWFGMAQYFLLRACWRSIRKPKLA